MSALQGILTVPVMDGELAPKSDAKLAYEYADAMIEERNRVKGTIE